MLDIFIIEDEPSTLRNITEVINSRCPETRIIGESATIRDSIFKLTQLSPGLVLMDINLKDGISFEILENIQEINFKVIFITAYQQYAIRAIKFSALDYLLKPLNPFELIQSIENARRNIDEDNLQVRLEALLLNLKDHTNKIEKIVLKTQESIHLVDIDSIVHCESDNMYTKFFLSDNRTIMVSKTLKEYDDLLKDSGFLRVHKSHIVNTRFIDRFMKRNGGYLVLKNEKQIPVSQRKKESILKLFDSL